MISSRHEQDIATASREMFRTLRVLATRTQAWKLDKTPANREGVLAAARALVAADDALDAAREAIR